MDFLQKKLLGKNIAYSGFKLIWVFILIVFSQSYSQQNLGDDWQFYGDSETDGRATETPSLISQNAAFLTIYAGNFDTTGLNFFKHGVGGESLQQSRARYNDNSNHPNATWVHFQESGNQDLDGERTASEFASSFESFVREIATQSPNAIISTETAYSFERESTSYRDWSGHNSAMKQKIAELQGDGINVYVAEVDSAIKVLVSNLGFDNVMTSDGGHFQGNGNFLVALMMFKSLGYNLSSMSFDHISTSELSASERDLCLQIAGSSSTPTDNTPPSAPGSLQGSASGPGSVNLSWQAATDNESNVVRYKIYMDDNLLDSTTSRSFSVTGLSPETQYSFEVSAVNSAGLEGNRSGAIQLTTEAASNQADAPMAPDSLKTYMDPQGNVVLSWQDPNPPSNSTVFRIFKDGEILDSTQELQYTDVSGNINQEFSYRVQCITEQAVSSELSSASEISTNVHNLDSLIILVNYGENESGNNYGTGFFNIPIMDRYTGYYPQGNGSVGITEGENKDYNFQGLTGEYLNLEAGQFIYALWYNNTDSTIQFTPQFSSSDSDRPVSGDEGLWHPMSETTIQAGEYGTSIYEIKEQDAGYYNLININGNFASRGGLLLSIIGWSATNEISSVKRQVASPAKIFANSHYWIIHLENPELNSQAEVGLYNMEGKKLGSAFPMGKNKWKLLNPKIKGPLFVKIGGYLSILPINY